MVKSLVPSLFAVTTTTAAAASILLLLLVPSAQAQWRWPSFPDIPSWEDDIPVTYPIWPRYEKLLDISRFLWPRWNEESDPSRYALIHFPSLPKKKSRKPKPKLPLVINLHALGSNPLFQMAISEFNPLADKHDFIVVYPDGGANAKLPATWEKLIELIPDPVWWLKRALEDITESPLAPPAWFLDFSLNANINNAINLIQGKSWNAGGCCGGATDEKIDDIQFLRDTIEFIQNVSPFGHHFELDMDRIYVTGMSNGAFMTHRVACEMSDLIAAAAPVAGPLSEKKAIGTYENMWDSDPFTCEPERKVPILYFSNTEDKIVPYNGSTDFGFPSANDTIQRWIQINGLTDEREEVKQRKQDGKATCWKYGAGQEGEIEFCELRSEKTLGHCWPGKSSSDIQPFLCDTEVVDSEYIWSFFEGKRLSKVSGSSLRDDL